MMRKLWIILLAACLACNQQAKDSRAPVDSMPADGTELNDTTPAGADTTRRPVVPEPQGLYRVVLPGRVEQTLAFYPGRRYRLEERNGALPSRAQGKWAPAGGNLWLYREGAVVARCRWQGDTLVYLFKGKEYPMEALMFAMDNTAWRAKKKAGVEFFGVGNEPFWNIEIDEQKAIAFHLADWKRPMRFPPARPIKSGDSLEYHTANDSATLRVVVYQRFCSDGMSDYTYDQQVKVIYNATVYNGCGLLFK